MNVEDDTNTDQNSPLRSFIIQCGVDNAYADTTGLANCKTCALGSKTGGGTSTTREACTGCAGGVRCDGNSGQVTCTAGSYAGAGSSACSGCGADNKHSAAGATVCATCNIGFYTAGNTANTRATCSPCLAGSACSGTSSIILCPRGTAVNAGGTACVDCGSDSTYSASTGATTCATCVAGSFTAGGTPTQRHSCSPCTSGSKCSGTATVVSCGDDKSYSGPGASTCSICGGGSFTSGGAADGKTRSSCSSCLGGNSCDGSSSPVQCTAGYYSPPASPNCLPCGAGHKYSSAGASTCSTCPAGFRTEGGTSVTRTKCSVCPTGTRRRDLMYSSCSVLDALLCLMSSEQSCFLMNAFPLLSSSLPLVFSHFSSSSQVHPVDPETALCHPVHPESSRRRGVPRVNRADPTSCTPTLGRASVAPVLLVHLPAVGRRLPARRVAHAPRGAFVRTGRAQPPNVVSIIARDAPPPS